VRIEGFKVGIKLVKVILKLGFLGVGIVGLVILKS